MEQVDLTVSIDSVRLDALQFYLSKKENTTLQTVLEKMLVEMYEKYVPAETRQYLDSKIMPTAVPKTRAKRQATKNQTTQNSNSEEVTNGQ